MKNTYSRKAVILGNTVIAILALAVAYVASFLTFDLMLYVPPDGGSPADGFIFLFILFIGTPICVVVAILSPFAAHFLFKKKQARIERICFSFLAPVIAAVVTSAIMMWRSGAC